MCYVNTLSRSLHTSAGESIDDIGTFWLSANDRFYVGNCIEYNTQATFGCCCKLILNSSVLLAGK